MNSHFNKKMMSKWSNLLFYIMIFVITSSQSGHAAVEDLSFSGRKTFSYSTENKTAAGNEESVSNFEQSLRFAMQGNLHDQVETDLRFDDQLPSKVEKMSFRYHGERFQMTVGDFQLKREEFAIPENQLRGVLARYQDEKSQVALFLSRPESRLVIETLRGTGERGPYFLSTGKLLAESEIVLRRELRLTRNIDYVIDYNSGFIEFTDPVPVGELIDLRCRVEDYNVAGQDHLLAFQGQTMISDKSDFQLKLYRRDNTDDLNHQYSHTELNLGQHLQLSNRLDLDTEFAHSFMEKDRQQSGRDNRMFLSTRYALGPGGIRLHYGQNGEAYQSIFQTGEVPSKKFGVGLDFNRRGLINELSLMRLEGDSLGSRDVLSGNVDYMHDSRYSLTGNYRFRKPNDSEELDTLGSVKGKMQFGKIKMENRFTIQDGLTLFQQERNIEKIADSEFRLTTSPRERTVYLLEGRRQEETLETDDSTLRWNSRLRVLHHLNRRTQLNSSIFLQQWNDLGDEEQQFESVLTHRMNKKLTLDTRYFNRTSEETTGVSGQGVRFGARWLPLTNLRVMGNVGIKDHLLQRIGISNRLYSKDVRMMYFPDSNLSLEVSGSMEDVGLDSVTGRDLGDRQRTGGKMTYKLSKGIRFLADLNLTADRIPQKREQVNWKTEISFRVRQNMNFFLDFSKFETVFPDEREWDSVTSRGGFRLEAQI